MPSAFVGVADHAGWAVLITVAGGALVDRRRVELVDPGVPVMPHHHDALKLPLDEGVALVARVRASARACAERALAALAEEHPIAGIALRERPPLPPTVEERLISYRAQNVADWVMYRETLAEAAEARGWTVRWFDRKRIFDEAAAALGGDLDTLLRATGKRLGPPWQADHRMAMAAAIAAGGHR